MQGRSSSLHGKAGHKRATIVAPLSWVILHLGTMGVNEIEVVIQCVPPLPPGALRSTTGAPTHHAVPSIVGGNRATSEGRTANTDSAGGKKIKLARPSGMYRGGDIAKRFQRL